MEDKIELNVFLSKLVTNVVKKFETIEGGIKDLRMQVDSLKQSINELKQASNGNSLRLMDEKIRGLETTVNSLKGKSQIDTSILKLIETEEGQRKVM